MDITGKADPYVDVYIDGKQKRSSKCKGTFKSVSSSLNPIWDETLEFHGTLSGFMSDVLHLKVKDWGGNAGPNASPNPKPNPKPTPKP